MSNSSENAMRRPSPWRTSLSKIGVHARHATTGEPETAARDRLLRGYIQSRQLLERSIERCEGAETLRFLQMVRARVDERIHELSAREIGAWDVAARLPVSDTAGSRPRVERGLTAHGA